VSVHPAADVGWYRRDRTMDLGAAVALVGAALVAAYAPAAMAYPGAAVLAALALLATLAYRERWVERRDGDVVVCRRWWLGRPYRTREARLPGPVRAVLYGPGTALGGKGGAMVALEGGAETVSLERWNERSQLQYAQSVRDRLERWLQSSPVEAHAAGQEARWAGLRASLATVGRPPRPAASRVAFHDHGGEQRLIGERWKIELAWAWGRILVGLGLLWVGVLPATGWEAVALLAALPFGALLLIDGLREALPGRVVTAIGPDALWIERAGPGRDLRRHVPFADVTAVGFDPSGIATVLGLDAPPAIVLQLGTFTTVLGARPLGARAEDMAWIAGSIAAALEAWSRRVAGPGEPGATEKPATLPAATPFPEDRVRPRFALAALSASFPRLGTLLAVWALFVPIVAARAVERRAAEVPIHLRFTWPALLPWLTAEAAAVAAGVAAGFLVVAAAIRLEWSAPQFRGQALVFLFWGAALWPLFSAGALGDSLVETANICLGHAAPPRYAVEVTGNVMRYGPRRFELHVGSHGSKHATPFAVIKGARAGDLLEVRGKLGGLMLVERESYQRTCGRWPGSPAVEGPARAPVIP
jgi:hypothetical protein